MPTIIARIEPDTKTRFQALAKARRLTQSELLRAIVLSVTGQNTLAEQPIMPEPENADLDRLTVRLPRGLKKAVASKAKSTGMTSSRWVAALIQSNLTANPVMTGAEIEALQASTRELAAIGRNINQIARVLNDAFYETEKVRLDKLEELNKAITENRDAIRDLVRASNGVWGVK